MTLAAGTRFGPYEILAALGAGGIGEVYKARDTRLDRTVAIKILPDAFASDPQFRDRFDREARTISQLDHPHICSLYDVGEQGGTSFLVMQYLEGETLEARLKKGALPLDQALQYAIHIADALATAHKAGVVHRDLKPGNVMLTKSGAKLLDFGLAKTTPVGAAAGLSMLPTTPPNLTAHGTILGTFQYMAPEQLEGQEADARTDIFAFGAVAYEMITGKKAFDGKSQASLIGAIMHAEPTPISTMQPLTPPSLDHVVKRCLAKEPDNRWQSASDVKAVLELVGTGTVTDRFAQTQRLPHNWLSWAMVAAVTLAFGAVSFIHFREQAPAAALTRFQIPLPANETFPSQAPHELSPDGRKLAFVTVGADGKLHLWIRSLDTLDARLMPGIEPALGWTFLSDDSRSIAFLSADHKLKRADVSGGPAQTLCDAAEVWGGSWSRDGVILFADSLRGVMRVAETGGPCVALTALDPARQDVFHEFPKLLPDGRHFLYFRHSNTPGNSGIYIGAIDATPSQQSSKPLLVNEADPEYYVPSRNLSAGQLVFYREGTVLAQAFNPNKLELSGDPVPVAEHVGNVGGYNAFFSASTTGVLTYVSGDSFGNAQLTWFDRQGKNLGTVGEPGIFVDRIALSPDGKQAAVSRTDPQSAYKANLWLLDLTRGGLSKRFTFDASVDDLPVWSSDGSRIIFTSTRDGFANLYQKLSSGLKNEELLLKSDEAKGPTSWSPDGRFLLYSAQPRFNLDSHLWILPMDGTNKQMLLQGTEFNEGGAQFSPDGRWIAYTSNQSGRYEVYVREFSIGSDGRPEATVGHQISNGGFSPHWGDGGKELLYLSPDRKTMMSVEISATKPVFQFSSAKPLFPLPTGLMTTPAVTADGKRFLVAVPVSQSGPQQFSVVLNWQAQLKQ